MASGDKCQHRACVPTPTRNDKVHELDNKPEEKENGGELVRQLEHTPQWTFLESPNNKPAYHLKGYDHGDETRYVIREKL